MRKKTIVKISAPGKIIFSGEHAVVFGYPAILASTNLRLKTLIKKTPFEKIPSGFSYYAFKTALKRVGINFRRYSFEIRSDIPVGSGMGSSAALSVSMAGASLILAKKAWNLEEINEIAYNLEKKQHGNPSGGDNTISTYGGFLWYRKESENLKVFTKFKPKISFPRFYLVNSGKPKETTRDMVLMVKERYQRNPGKIEKIFKEIESCTKGFLNYLTKEENSNLRELIKTNEVLLEELGVVSFRTRDLIKKLAKINTFAKVSGAGGMALGSGMLLAYPKDRQKFLRFAKSQNLDIISVKFGGEGVRKDLK